MLKLISIHALADFVGIALDFTAHLLELLI